MMTREGSTQIENFMTSGAGVLARTSVWPYKSYIVVKIHYSF